MKKYLEPTLEIYLNGCDILLSSNEIDLDFEDWVDE